VRSSDLAGELAAGRVDVVAARLARRGDDTGVEELLREARIRSGGERFRPDWGTD
jgi:hypothetical protein